MGQVNPAALLALALAQSAGAELRPPAVPLIAHDPYFSVWSFSNGLADSETRHWTGTPQPLSSLVRVDGVTYRLMGMGASPALPQTGLKVWPTRTVYSFAGAGVEIKLTFTTPTLPDELEVLSRPATYITWDIRGTDGKTHETQVYFNADSRLAVNVPSQEVVWDHRIVDSLFAVRIGSEEQPVLQKRGDNLRIDWGHLIVAGTGKAYSGSSERGQEVFEKTGHVPSEEKSKPTPASANVGAAFAIPFGKVGEKVVSHHIVVAYDDEYSIQFMGHNLRPYWRRNGADTSALLSQVEKDYSRLTARCEEFDKTLTADLVHTGGQEYADLASLAFRQSFAAQKVAADSKGLPLMFSKENFSNGCISTVDVLYPAAPQLLFFSPTLVKASLSPILEYAASPRWKWPFAPHDLGTYPKANGQVYGGGERTEENQMPVEESGNLLILLAALAKVEGNANYSKEYWPQLSKWAEYLAKEGFDPASQLSTDDFAGHLAHNVNLSAKAIEALGSYAYLAEKLGHTEESSKYRKMAEEFAHRWVEEAADGDHYKLAFDRPGTWSQKYNLVWDRILKLDLFPESVIRKEMDFYRTKINPFGLPLDSRKDYTKLDWEVWTASLTGERRDFERIMGPIIHFLNETPDRIPMTDWYDTVTAKHEGFQARSVVGGVFIKMLDTAHWSDYAGRDPGVIGAWAPLPTPPILTNVVPTAIEAPIDWTFTTEKPIDTWFEPAFSPTGWQHGPSGFGAGDTRGGVIRTAWTKDDIWMRREFDIPEGSLRDLQLFVAHDDGAEVYVNGVLAVHLSNAAGYEAYELPKSVRATLKATHNVIAIHCHNDGGDQYIDAGFVTSHFGK